MPESPPVEQNGQFCSIGYLWNLLPTRNNVEPYPAYRGLSVEKYVAKSFREFLDHIEFFDLVTDKMLFRGQPIEGDLLPAISRKNRSFNTREREMETIEQVRLMGATFLAGRDPNLLDTLVLAQHYGLKTRLLDWTSSPLAALWFACADQSSDGDVFVYALEAHDLLKQDIYSVDPFSVRKTRAFQPRLNNPRIIAQHGWFTLHCFSSTSKSFVPLERNRETKEHLTQLCIPAKARKNVLDLLDRFGISYRTLFPDLGGLCQYLNWKLRL